VATTAVRAYLGLGAVAIAAYVAFGGVYPIYESLGLLAAAATVVGIVVHRPVARAGWIVLAVSEAVFGISDIVYFRGYDGLPPFPSGADYGYLLADVLLAVALVLLIRTASPQHDLPSYFDAGVLALALSLLIWAAAFAGSFGMGRGLTRFFSVAYPVIDLVLLALVVRLMLVRGTRSFSFVALCLGVLCLLGSNCWYVVPAVTDSYVAGTWRDAGWLGSYVFFGAAALHPSMKRLVVAQAQALPIRRVIFLGLSLVVVAVAPAVQLALTGKVSVYPFAVIGGLMAVFVAARVAGVVRDLERTRGEAEQSERRFRLVFERAPIGISVGRDGIMSETNPALQRMLGYSAEEFARMHYTEVTDPDDRWSEVQNELDLGTRDAFAIEKRYVRKDGTPVETHVHVALDLEDGLGISLIEDVTGRRALEEQLRQAQKMEAIGKLAGGIAHDFNNLMTAVIGYSDLLLRDYSDEKIEAIRDSAERAANLTRQLLAFSRRQIMQTQEIDLRDVADHMDSFLRRLIGEDVRLVTETDDRPVIVRADRTQLEQVVMNLAVNARDAMPSGGTLTLAVAIEGQTAILSVADTGTGMDADVQERIFEPFFTTKSLAVSSGLGLSTVHGIVGQSGGTIEVESAPGRGTRFTVRLPLLDGAVLPEAGVRATLID
jgi:PAS domain S-box-containing protein